MRQFNKLLFRPLLIALITFLAVNVVQAQTTYTYSGAIAPDNGAIGTDTEAYLNNGAWENDQNAYVSQLYLNISSFGSFAVDDIDYISYVTKKDEVTASNPDFFLKIYTKGNQQGWYNYRLNAEPYFSNDLDGPANQWNQWNTNEGTNQLTFFDSNVSGVGYGFYGQPTLQDIQNGSINWNNYNNNAASTNIDYGAEEVKYIVMGTGSGWNGSFEGYLDQIKISVNGTEVIYDLENNVSSLVVDDDWTSETPGALVDDGYVFGSNAFASIQDAIDAAANGATIEVYPGEYTENADYDPNTNTNSGDNPLGLLINKEITLQGVDASGNSINDVNSLVAKIISGYQSNWGTNFLVSAPNVSAIGLEFIGSDGSQSGYVNKAIEVVSDNFTLKHCKVGANTGLDMYSSVYINDQNVPSDTDPDTFVSSISSYTINENELRGSFTTTNGPGWGVSSPSLEVTNNEFINDPESSEANAGIYVTGYDDEVAWRNAPALFPTDITGNVMADDVGGIMMVRDDDPSRFPTENQIEDFINNNDLPAGVYIKESEGGLRLEDSPTGSTNNFQVRMTIQAAIDAASSGDVIEVAEGTYDEAVNVDVTGLTLKGPNYGVTGYSESRIGEATIEGQVIISADNVTFDGFDVTPPDATTNSESEAIRISNSPDNVVVSNSIVRDFSEDGLGQWIGLDGIVAFGGSGSDAIENITITGNLVKNLDGRDTEGGAAGISIQGNVNGATVENNVSQNIGMESTAWAFGITVRKTGNHSILPQNVSIGNNTIEQILSNPSSATVGVGLGLESGSATFTNNEVSNTEFLLEDKTESLDLATIIANNTFDRGAYFNGSASGSYIIFNKIQDAIDAASDGDVIKVADGTYEEAITLNKPNITVQSINGKEETTIDTPDGNLTTSVEVEANMGTVVFDGFTVTGFTEAGIIQGMSAGTGTTFKVYNNEVIPADDYLRNGIEVTGDGSEIIGNIVHGAPLTEDWAGTALMVANASNVTVKSNEVVGNSDVGISVLNWDVSLVDNITVEDNNISGAGNGIRISGYNSTEPHSDVKNVSILDNTLNENEKGINAQTVVLENLTVSGNDISDNSDIGIRFSGSSATLNGSMLIQNNKLTNNTNKAIKNGASTNVDATCNWWGTTASSTIGTMVEGDVDWSTVLDSWPAYSANCISPIGNEVTNETQNETYTTLDAAISDAVAEDVIVFGEGTFGLAKSTQINITVPLTLTGNNAGVSAGANPETRNPETIIDGGFYIHSGASGTVIDGFTIKNGFTSSSHQVGVMTSDKDVEIKNNIIKDCTGSQSQGIETTANADNLLVKDNEIANNYTGMYINPSDGITVQGNAIHDNNGSGAGIGSDGLSNFLLTGNHFYNQDLEGWGSINVGENVVAYQNKFETGSAGINHYGGQQIDASHNWWGDPSGPSTGSKGTGDEITGDVNYEPYYIDAEMTQLSGGDAIDIAIHEDGCGLFEVVLRPAADLTDNTGITNLQFTVKWPIDAGDVTFTPASGLQQQGPVFTSNGYNYATYAGATLYLFGDTDWTAGDEHQVMTFSHDQSGTGTGDFIIMNDNDSEAGLSNVFYAEYQGSDATGINYANAMDSWLDGCPVENVTQNKWYYTIQGAIDEANSAGGDEIEVYYKSRNAGIFVEDLEIDKGLTLNGPNAGTSPNTNSRDNEVVIHPATSGGGWYDALITIDANNITIDGFTIDGDNPSIITGFNNTTGADIDAGEGISTLFDRSTSNLIVKNNIIKNFSIVGVDIAGEGGSAAATTGNLVDDNLFQDLGTYDDSSPSPLWGVGVIIYYQQYTEITDNEMINVRIGVQTGQFGAIEPAPQNSHTISGNSIQARKRGIFFNEHYGSTPFLVENNQFTAIDNANETEWQGLLIAGQHAISSDFTNNTINGSGLTNCESSGIEVWNVKDVAKPIISEGTISNTDYGIFLNNYEGYSSNGSNGAHAEIFGMTIEPNTDGIGVYGLDSPDYDGTDDAFIDLNVHNNVIDGGETGIKLDETRANSVSAVINDNSIINNTNLSINSLIANQVSATCNWWGSANINDVAAEVTGDVVYTPFLITDDENSSSTYTDGFDPLGPCATALSVKVWLQGPYDAANNLMNTDINVELPTAQPFNQAPWNYTGTETLPSPLPTDVVDWVLVELRTDETTSFEKAAGLLYEDGSVVANFSGNVDQFTPYYIVVYQRNHMPVMSDAAVVPGSYTFPYDFADLANLYGNTTGTVNQPAVELETGVWGMIAGDVTANGLLQYSGPGNDRGPIIAKIIAEGGENLNSTVSPGYWYEDVNMNNELKYLGTNDDRAIIIGNLNDLTTTNQLNELYQSQVPGVFGGFKDASINDGPVNIDIESDQLMLTATEEISRHVMDNIQFTLAWKAGNTDARAAVESFSSEYGLFAQGEPVIEDGIAHQMFASIKLNKLPASWSKGQKMDIMSFDASVEGDVWVADNTFTTHNNSMYYVSLDGEDNTGAIKTNRINPDSPASAESIHVYPNPVTDGKLYIEVSSDNVPAQLTLGIYDTRGNLVRTKQVTGSDAHHILMNVNSLSAGVYVVQITGQTFQTQERFIISK